MIRVLKQEDILKISDFLTKNGYSGLDIELTNYVESQEVLNKVNEEFFYRSEEHDKGDFNSECDGVDIECDGVKFKFRVRETNENSQE